VVPLGSTFVTRAPACPERSRRAVVEEGGDDVGVGGGVGHHTQAVFFVPLLGVTDAALSARQHVVVEVVAVVPAISPMQPYLSVALIYSKKQIGD